MVCFFECLLNMFLRIGEMMDNKMWDIYRGLFFMDRCKFEVLLVWKKVWGEFLDFLVRD